MARRQHGVVSRLQLLESGYTDEAIRHRRRTGQLHDLHRGVYAVGSPDLGREGHWMAAVLAAGDAAVLSHGSAAALWGLEREVGPIEISVRCERNPRGKGLRVHRRKLLEPADLTRRHRIPVTKPARTLLDLANRLGPRRLERAVNEADKLDLIDPESLRRWVAGRKGEDGAAALRALLDRDTFVLTDSELERRLLPIARSAGLPTPETQALVAGFRVDFLFRDVALVVETDGLRYHRTPAQQARDRVRDHALFAAGFTALRFTHAQVAHEPERVEEVMRAALRR